MKSILRLVAAAALTFSTLAARAAGFAPVTKRVLPNGLTVLIQERHTAPVVTTMMWYKVGSRDEIPGSTGLAHFLEHLMFKGTRRFGKGMVDRLTYQSGGTNNAFTADDYTAYYFNLPKSQWRVALQIEADRIRNLLFDPAEFEAERKVIMDERRERTEDDPSSELEEQLNSVAFVAHPYRNPTIGWMSDLRRITRAQVIDFYNHFYVPANAALVIEGDVDTREALREATAAFAAVPRLPAPAHRVVTEPAQIAQRRVELSIPAKLPRVQLMFHTPQRGNADVYPLEVLQYVLTQGRSSRLYQRLVERERLASDVAASLSVTRDPDIFDVYVDLKGGASPQQAETAIWDELARLAATPISDHELRQAQNTIAAHQVHERQTCQDAATELGEAEATGGYEYLLTYLDRIQRVTPADVQRVARAYFHREQASIGYLLPAGDRPARGTRAAGIIPVRVAARRLRPAAPRPGAQTYRRRRSGRRQQPPPPPPGIPAFPSLHVTERTLSNGLHLLLLENHDLPSITIDAQVLAGSRDETDATAGLANFTAQTLDEGTREYSHREIDAALEFVGADFSAAAGRQTTTIALTSLSEHVRSLLPVYASMITAPTFPAERVDLERSNILTDIAADDEDAADIAGRLFYEKVYGTHPYHRPVIGYARTVARIAPDQLRRFHARFYVPGATTIAAVGDFNTAAMLADLTRVFSGWRARTPPGHPAPAAALASGIVQERRTLEKTQSQIVLGHLGINRMDPDFGPLLVMDTVLGEAGAGFTARIPYQVRDVQGLAYSVESSITATASLDPGVFTAEMGTEPKNEARAVAAVLKEIRRIREQPISGAELYGAIHYLVSSYIFDFQTNGQLAEYLLMTSRYGLGANYRQAFVKQLRAVTQADVLRAARAHLFPDRYTLVVVGPAKQ